MVPRHVRNISCYSMVEMETSCHAHADANMDDCDVNVDAACMQNVCRFGETKGGNGVQT